MRLRNALALLLVCGAAWPALGQVRQIRPIQLDPASRPADTEPPAQVSMGDWKVHIERAEAGAGVPWKLIALPVSSLAERLRPSRDYTAAGLAESIPFVPVPEQLWEKWFTPDLKDVVGIHYHEMFGVDPARILITIHKVPADGPDGKPPADYSGVSGTRVEATLLTPLTFYMDQAIVVRSDAVGATEKGGRPHFEDGKNGPGGHSGHGEHGAGASARTKIEAREAQARAARRAKLSDRTNSRLDHESGHAALSLKVALEVLAGPQDWNLPACKGRKSTLVWYYEPTKVMRRWDGYTGGSGKLNTQRLAITMAPPTRWSMMVPLPPDDVTQAQIQGFNDWIALPQLRFVIEDGEAQRLFHLEHGEYEEAR